MDYRLKKQKDFDILFHKGVRINTKTLTLIFFKSKELKYGISLSKKHGKAVIRNRIKRLLRASFNNFLPLIKDKYYIILLPKILKYYKYDNFCEDIKYALIKGNIIND